MPEAYALARIYWQFFVTLTLRSPSQHVRLEHRTALFTWLRTVAGLNPCVHFRRLLWVIRAEFGRGGNLHFHALIAGKRSGTVSREMCVVLEKAWRKKAGGIALVQLYDHARDGVGYILKTRHTPCPHGGNQRARDEDQTYPMLSKSVFETIRRGRM
jgi:hypothetical protein